ncbi:MAG: hypothetical protein ACOYI5_04480 [Christensenellales bacterium]|jgi:hypothetical protein
MTNPAAKTSRNTMQMLIYIAAGALLLALIVVSAFAYQWHGENVELKKRNITLRALSDDSTISSMNNEIMSIQQSLIAEQAANDELTRQLREYEAILSEHDLLPAAQD